jgi:hypothetical protein
MKRVSFRKFNQTKLVPHITWTNNKQDKPPRDKWDVELWVESAEDMYALMHYARERKTALVVSRGDFLTAPDAEESK